MFYHRAPMSDKRANGKQRLDKAIASLTGKYGPSIVQSGEDLPALVIPPHISTGFASLDALTGCKGIPLGHLSLFTGRTTSGKLTLAYRVLTQAQGRGRRPDNVAILDLTHASDPDYIARCGLNLQHTLFVRPPQPEQAVALIYDLVRGYDLRMLLVDGLSDLLRNASIARAFDAALPQLHLLLKQTRSGLLFLDEPAPPWLRWARLGSGALMHYAALHVDLKREQWIQQRDGTVMGYVAQAHLSKSKWARTDGTCTLQIALCQ